MPYDDSFRGHEVWKLRKYSIALPNGPDGFENALRDNAATVAANTVGATHNTGGALFSDRGSVLLRGCRFVGNGANGKGGAVYLDFATAVLSPLPARSLAFSVASCTRR